MNIGIPKEIMAGERRVSATPEVCKKYIERGFKVYVESNAGFGSLYLDQQYLESGAEIIDNPHNLYKKADLVLKVKEPQYNEAYQCSEIEMMHEGQVLVTFLHPASPNNHDMVRKLAAQKITSLTLDSIPRITKAQNMDALTSMSTCAGYKGMLMAACEIEKFIPQIFTAAGMTKPAKAIVIGTGVAGLQALATAKRLGADVTAADIRPEAIEQAKSLGARTVDLGVPVKHAVGDGGYARDLKDKWLKQERKILEQVLPEFDIVFCSALVPGHPAPVLLTRDMVATMKAGSVVVDVSIDQGGNCELTQPGEIYSTENHVKIIGIKNIPGLIPNSSTNMFSNNMFNLVNYLLKPDSLSFDAKDEVIEPMITTMDGKIWHQPTLEAMKHFR